MDDSGFEFRQGQGLSLIQNVQTGSGDHPTYSMGTGRSFLEVKRPGREVGRSPPSSAEVKNKWSYTYSSLVCPHGVCKDDITLLPLFISSLQAKEPR